MRAEYQSEIWSEDSKTLKFMSLIDTTREDTMKNEWLYKTATNINSNFKEEGNKTGGRRMQKIKKKEGYIVTDRLEVHKVERSSNVWVSYIQDKIYAEIIIVFHTKSNFFPIYLLSPHLCRVAFIAIWSIMNGIWNVLISVSFFTNS
jgi:hypothetical protein